MKRVLKTLSVAILSFVVISTSGCGGSGIASPVEGTVTFDGKPLSDATVTFQPAKGRPSVGLTDSEGFYRLKFTGTENGAIPGQHKVSITTTIEGMSGEGDQPSIEGREEILPAKYHSESELTAVVEDESNTVNFDLTSE